MPIQFRKTSIRSRKRTLGLAALGLIVDGIVSHPRVDVAAVVDVAMMSRFAAGPLMASLGGLSWTVSTKSNNSVPTTPAARLDRGEWTCASALHRELINGRREWRRNPGLMPDPPTGPG